MNYTVICYYKYTNGMRNHVNQQLASVGDHLLLVGGGAFVVVRHRWSLLIAGGCRSSFAAVRCRSFVIGGNQWWSLLVAGGCRSSFIVVRYHSLSFAAVAAVCCRPLSFACDHCSSLVVVVLSFAVVCCRSLVVGGNQWWSVVIIGGRWWLLFFVHCRSLSFIVVRYHSLSFAAVAVVCCRLLLSACDHCSFAVVRSS